MSRKRPLLIEQGIERPLKKPKELGLTDIQKEYRAIGQVLEPLLIRDLVPLVLGYLNLPNIHGDLVEEIVLSSSSDRICAGPRDECFVANWNKDSIQIVDLNDGRLLREWGGKRWFNGRTFLAFSAHSSELFTLNNNLIQVFSSSSGDLLRRQRLRAPYCQPVALAISECHILIARTDDMVHMYDVKTGAAVSAWTLALERDEIIQPEAMAMAEEHVFVVLEHLHCIREYQESNGQFIRLFGKNILFYPTALAVSGHEIYVADFNLRGVKVLSREDGALVRHWSSDKHITDLALMGSVLLGCSEQRCWVWK